MAIGVRVKDSGSWLDPNCAGLLGWKLGRRLWRRCAGEIGLFLTLTYRRDEYASAQELYYRQQERQDVALFMRRLGRALGVSFKGKFLCKAEFQAGGWIHFHLVILGRSFIDHDLLERCWRHGFVWVKRLSKKKCLYCCKYVAKNGRIPLWLYGEAPKSVKVVRVSPGFWVRPGEEPPPKRVRADVALWPDGTPVKGAKVHGCYVPIGIRLRQRGVLINFNGRIFSRRCEPSQFMLRCQRYALRVSVADGWIWYEVPGRGVEWILGGGGLGGPAAAPERREDRGPPPPGGLHLRGTSNPDALRGSIMQTHWYIEAEYVADALEQAA